VYNGFVLILKFLERLLFWGGGNLCVGCYLKQHPTLTNNMTQLLLIGVLFAIIGLCTLIFRKQKKLVGLIPLIIGLTAIFLTTIGPLSQSQAQINKVLKLDKKEVAKVIIRPIEYRGYEKISLTQNIVEITDRNTIDSLCLSLIKAKTTNSIIKNPKWVSLVRFEKIDDSFLELEVKNAGTVTFVEVKSNGDYGWNYGTLDAKSFGQFLSTLTR
jgi:hypothetical protein